MRLVLDTNGLVAAQRSATGASARLVEAVRAGRVNALASVALFLEYEAVLTRREQLAAAGLDAETALKALSALAALIEPVEIHFRLRPAANDPDDDMVLEAAVNGRADALVTFDLGAFDPAAARHGISLMTPALIWRMIRT